MNIALITFSISDRSGSRAPIRLAQYLKKLGHDIHLFSYNIGLDSELKVRLEKEGIKVTVYEISNNLPFPLVGISKLTRMVTDLKNGQFDIISFHSNLLSLLAAKLSGQKILATYYGTEFSYKKIRSEAKMPIKTGWVSSLKSELSDLILTFLQRIYFWLCDDAVAISQYLSYEADKYFNRKLKVIYLGAETDFFKPDVPITESDFILSVSRIVPYKGFDLLIEAFKKANEKKPNLKLIIVGSVANSNYLTYLNSISNKQVEIRSNLSDFELQKLYSSCLLYATCDLWAPWSLTPLEASFFSKPLLALDFGSMKEIIKDGQNGFLSKNITEFSDKITELADNSRLRSSFGLKAKQLVSEYKWVNTAQEYDLFFKKVINVK